MRLYGTITRVRGEWRIEAEPHVIIRLKRVFQKVNKAEHAAIHLTDTLENCRELVWFLSRYPMSVSEEKYLYKRSRAYTRQSERLGSIISGQYEPRRFEMALPPRDYQKVAAEVTLQGGSLLLCDELGLGKTASAIAVLTEPSVRPALVVTMTHLPRQWASEIQKFTPGMRVQILKSGQPYSLTRERGRERPFPDIVITNYHKLSGWAPVLAGAMKAVIFDECQELRRTGSMKYSAAEHIAQRASIRMGLTATPIYNLGSEIFNVIRVLNPLVLGTQEEFHREWCNGFMDQHGRAAIHDPRAFGLYAREQAIMLRRTRKEVGRELPPLISIPQYIDADAEPLDEVESAATELARIILTQGGQERGEKLRASEELSWRLRQATGIAKAPHVASFCRMLLEQEHRIVLFGWHREVYSIWMERLADFRPVLYTGSESPAQKAASVERFLHGDARILIMSLRAGQGLDGLQGAAHVAVHGELDWSPGVHEQCNGRLYRDGLLEPMLSYYLITDSGSDPAIVDVLGIKRAQIDGIREPHGELIERLNRGEGHIQRLAEDYLRQKGLPIPAPDVTVTEESTAERRTG